MRLFTALLFDPNILDAMRAALSDLRGIAVRGNFTRPENLHLTLNFIGETENIAGAKRAVDRVAAEPFILGFGKPGVFRREEGLIVWIAAQASQALPKLQRGLSYQLGLEGFSPETRAYKPHITLGREVVLRAQEDVNRLSADLPDMRVARVSLMKSERALGKLVYTQIHSKIL